MQSIKLTNSAINWVIGPYREKSQGGSLIEWVKSSMRKYGTDYLYIHGDNACFSTESGYDFAGYLADEVKGTESYLYLEKRIDCWLLIYIRDGVVVKDQAFSSADEFESGVKFLMKFFDGAAVTVEAFGVALDSICNAKNSNAAIYELEQSRLESFDINYLDKNKKYLFQEYEIAKLSITDNKLQTVFFFGALSFIGFCFAFFGGFLDITSNKERINLVNPYSDYEKILYSQPGIGLRLVHDYKIQGLIESYLPNFSVYKVTHSVDAITYKLNPLTSNAKTSNIHLFANEFNLSFISVQGELILIAGIVNKPLFSEGNIKFYNLDLLSSFIVDNTQRVTPFASASISKATTHGNYRSSDVLISFKDASRHDLLRMAALLDGDETPFPIYFSPCSGGSCSYEISPLGVINGGIGATLYGDAK